MDEQLDPREQVATIIRNIWPEPGMKYTQADKAKMTYWIAEINKLLATEYDRGKVDGLSAGLALGEAIMNAEPEELEAAIKEAKAALAKLKSKGEVE